MLLRISIVCAFVIAMLAGSTLYAALCPKCSNKMYVMSIGQCSECDGYTSSGSHKICSKCSEKSARCEHCLAKLAVAAPKVPAKPGPAIKVKPALTLTDADDGKKFKITKGKKLTVTLESNQTTGYEWRVIPAGKEKPAAVLKFEGKEYLPTKPGRIGSGGHAVFTFKAIAKGTQKIELGYSQSWEKEEKPDETFSFTITVK